MFRATKKAFFISAVYLFELYILLKAWFNHYERMFCGCAIWLVLTTLFFLLAYAYQKNRNTSVLSMTRKQNVCLGAIITLCVLASTLPMNLSPYWNGEIPDHRNQYEAITESLLNGHLHFDYEADPRLLALENPYDPQQRYESGVQYHWDHALYNGKYYMYFGIVPVFMAFLPFRLLTGHPLTTYHATQLFTGLIIVSFFALFYLLSKVFFRRMSFSRYVSLSVSFSLLSIWYSVGFPAMYCTAITAAILLILWSLYLFIHAVWGKHSENTRIAYAFGGALCGALSFGCRPPIALANLLVIPMLVVYLRKFPLNLKRFAQLFLAASPYFVVACLLMLYNYARFGNPFEFGQTYQITIADQTHYGGLPSLNAWSGILQAAFDNFFTRPTFRAFGGIFANFPILLLSFGLLVPHTWRSLKDHQLLGVGCCLLVLPVIITLVDVMWSPILLTRYQLDVYFLLTLLCFIVVGTQETKGAGVGFVLDSAIFMLSLFTIATCIWFFCIPYDYNWSATYYPELLDRLIPLLSLGIFR